jgi:hypothetical protein
MKGRIDIIDFNGDKYTYGVTQENADKGVPYDFHHGVLHIHDETFWARVFLSSDIGCNYYHLLSRTSC